MNLVLITSIIKPPMLPLSYISTRSVYTFQERFEQTKLTIQSVKNKIPNCKIFLVECSNLTDDENTYFLENVDLFLNLNNHELSSNMHSASKSLCEGTMTICAINYLISNNINYDNLIKISGRYYLSESFNINNFNNNDIVIKQIDNNINNVFTGLYKLPKNCTEKLKCFLESNYNSMKMCIGYEVLFAQFINTLCENKIIVNPIGLQGNVSVCGTFYNG
jgi:hypothetical protein